MVSSSNYFLEYLIFYLEHEGEHEFFRCPTHGNGRRHERRRASTDVCLPGLSISSRLRQTPTPARSSTSSVSALLSSARLPWSVTCVSRSFRRTTRATRARSSVANASRACVSDVALLCFHPCVGLNARVRAVRAPARDVSSHRRVFFATRTHQFTVHLTTNKPLPNTHVRRSTAHWFPQLQQGRVARSATSCSFQSAARPTRCHVVPRFCHQAAPTRAAQGLTSGTRRAHEYRLLHERTDTNAIFTMCAHPVRYIDEAPLHYLRTIPSTRVT